MRQKKEKEEKIMKPEILDCTLRDGGLVNRFFFSDELVRDLYQTNLEAGVDYMEFSRRMGRISL